MTLDLNLLYSRPHGTTLSSSASSAPCSCGFAFAGQAGLVYNEEAFRQMLAIEKKRAQRSSRSSLLLLVRFRRHPELAVEMPPAIASTIFSGLGLCVREVDFVGWHREGRVAGAVLAQGPVVPGSDEIRRIAERITDVLRARLPVLTAHCLEVRVVRLSREVA